MAIEGQLSFLEIVSRETDDVVFRLNEQTETETLGDQQLVEAGYLPVGDYLLRSWQQACDDTCRILTPPMLECEAEFALTSDMGTAATITEPGEGPRGPARCVIEFSSTLPA